MQPAFPLQIWGNMAFDENSHIFFVLVLEMTAGHLDIDTVLCFSNLSHYTLQWSLVVALILTFFTRSKQVVLFSQYTIYHRTPSRRSPPTRKLWGRKSSPAAGGVCDIRTYVYSLPHALTFAAITTLKFRCQKNIVTLPLACDSIHRKRIYCRVQKPYTQVISLLDITI